MMSKIPSDLAQLSGKELNKELLRVGLIAELDAISLYEQLAVQTSDAAIKKCFADIAREEKTHVGEFQALLLRLDEEQVKEMEAGKEEVEEKFL